MDRETDDDELLVTVAAALDPMIAVRAQAHRSVLQQEIWKVRVGIERVYREFFPLNSHLILLQDAHGKTCQKAFAQLLEPLRQKVTRRRWQERRPELQRLINSQPDDILDFADKDLLWQIDRGFQRYQYFAAFAYAVRFFDRLIAGLSQDSRVPVLAVLLTTLPIEARLQALFRLLPPTSWGSTFIEPLLRTRATSLIAERFEQWWRTERVIQPEEDLHLLNLFRWRFLKLATQEERVLAEREVATLATAA